MPEQKYYDLRTKKNSNSNNHIMVQESSSDKFITMIPHGGTLVPLECLSYLNADGLIIDTDHYTPEIFSIEDYGSSVFTYLVHRGVIDINRGLEEPLQKDDGVFRTHRFDGEQVILKPYSPELEERLIHDLYQPFIREVESKIRNSIDKYGRAVIINGHSMEHRPNENRPGICIANDSKAHGDNPTSDAYIFKLIYESLHDNLTAQPEIKEGMNRLPHMIQEHHPFKGHKGLTKRFGQPKNNTDCVLLEVNQKLYLDYERVRQDPLGGKNEEMISLLNQYIGKSLKEAINVFYTG